MHGGLRGAEQHYGQRRWEGRPRGRGRASYGYRHACRPRGRSGCMREGLRGAGRHSIARCNAGRVACVAAGAPRSPRSPPTGVAEVCKRVSQISAGPCGKRHRLTGAPRVVVTAFTNHVGVDVCESGCRAPATIAGSEAGGAACAAAGAPQAVVAALTIHAGVDSRMRGGLLGAERLRVVWARAQPSRLGRGSASGGGAAPLCARKGARCAELAVEPLGEAEEQGEAGRGSGRNRGWACACRFS